MLIYTLWEQADDSDLPWLIDSIDEYAVEASDFPKEYLEKKARINVRELLITVPDTTVRTLFATPVVAGKFVE